MAVLFGCREGPKRFPIEKNTGRSFAPGEEGPAGKRGARLYFAASSDVFRMHSSIDSRSGMAGMAPLRVVVRLPEAFAN